MTKMKIDSTDIVILKELLRDARKSFTEIAKEINITSTAIRNRYLNMKKAGLITGSTILINPKALGLNCYGFLGVKAHQKKINEVKAYLIQQPGILCTWDKIQTINIGNYFSLPSLQDFAELTENMRKNPYIKEIQPLIYLGSPFNQHPDKLIIKPEIKENVSKEKASPHSQEIIAEPIEKKHIQTSQLLELNKTDREIIKILSKNARASFNGIAKKLNTSTVQIINRYEKLKEQKIFLNSSITVDPQKMGYTANAMVYINLEIGTNTNKIYNNICNMPNVITIVRVMGECDLLAIIPLREFRELFVLEKQIRAMKEIKKVQINLNPPFSEWPFNFFAQIF